MFGASGDPDHDDSTRIIHAALDAGINFIDTADVYSRGESEEIVGQALRGRRDAVVLATKAHASMGDDPNEGSNSRRWIVREVDNLLRRLQTDYIDLYQMHRPDPATDIDETLSRCPTLCGPGRCGRSARRRSQPSKSSKPSGWPSAAGVSGSAASAALFHPRPRHRGRGPAHLRRYGMGVIAWSPLAAGWLTGKYRKDRTST